MPDFEHIADLILMSPIHMNVPVEREPGMRVVGWKVKADDVGMSDVFEALRIIERRADAGGDPPKPIPLRLNCPTCGALHIDEGEFATKPHHTHSCQSCGMTWRPAVVPTVGVQFLPGFKNNP